MSIETGLTAIDGVMLAPTSLLVSANVQDHQNYFAECAARPINLISCQPGSGGSMNYPS